MFWNKPLKFLRLPVGPLGTNCYLVIDETHDTLFVIDPGAEAERILAAARAHLLKRVVILLTHCHVDHISALGMVAAELCPEYIFLGSEDEAFYRDPLNALPPYLPPAEALPATTSVIPGGEPFTRLALPGHTMGGSGFYFADAKLCFTGDSLFAGAIGRTDLPPVGSAEMLIGAIKKELYVLPDEVQVLPGHGMDSTIGTEKRTNPYVKGD